MSFTLATLHYIRLFLCYQFDYDGLWFGFLCVYSVWGLLSFLGSAGLNISSNLGVFSHDFDKQFLPPSLLYLLFDIVP